jgi:hypothetical protein
MTNPTPHDRASLESDHDRNQRSEATRIRDAILQGYHDLASGRTVEYQGDLRALLQKKSRRVLAVSNREAVSPVSRGSRSAPPVCGDKALMYPNGVPHPLCHDCATPSEFLTIAPHRPGVALACAR